MLINEMKSGSGVRLFPVAFRQQNVGPLIWENNLGGVLQKSSITIDRYGGRITVPITPYSIL
jgi:hypothetical protein